jgi:hypothetical protein
MQNRTVSTRASERGQVSAQETSRHTAAGKAAIHPLARECSPVRNALVAHVPEYRANEAACMAAFYADATPVAIRFDWNGSADVERLGTESDMMNAGVVRDGPHRCWRQFATILKNSTRSAPRFSGERAMADDQLLTRDNTLLSQPIIVFAETETDLVRTSIRAEQRDQLFAVNCKHTAGSVEAYIGAGITSATKRAYRADLNHFESWGGTIPATDALIAAYLWDHAALLKVSTLTRRLAAVSIAHNVRDPPTRSARLWFELPCEAFDEVKEPPNDRPGRSFERICSLFDPADLGPAEKAFQTAIAIAKEQRARSFGLQAALSLAKLCQSMNRPADARVVLTPALEGFAPTPEMPDIAEAQALMDRLV